MKTIFDQIKTNTSIDDKRDSVTIKFPKQNLEYKFNMTRGRIDIPHKSHAVVAAVTGKTINYKSTEIRCTNRIFEWLDIKYDIDYNIIEKRSSSMLDDGVISFFN